MMRRTIALLPRSATVSVLSALVATLLSLIASPGLAAAAPMLSAAATGVLLLSQAVPDGIAAAPTSSPDGVSQITSTDEHPYWVTSRTTRGPLTTGAWVPAADLKPGDQLLTANGGTATITTIHTQQATVTAYNLSITGPHTYHTGTAATLVHNCPTGDGAASTGNASAANSGSALSRASGAAFRAADNPASMFVKNKHVASAGGNGAKFVTDDISQVQGWISRGLQSDGVQFLPNQLDDTFRAIVPGGGVVGTRGQEFIRVIVTGDGRVINAFRVSVR